MQLLLLHDVFPNAHRGTVIDSSDEPPPPGAHVPLAAYKRDLQRVRPD